MFQIYDEACISFLRKGFGVTETFSFTLDRVSFFVRFRFSPAFPSDDLFSPFSDFTSPGKHVARYRLLFRREKTDLLAYIPSCFHFLPVYKDFTSSKKKDPPTQRSRCSLCVFSTENILFRAFDAPKQRRRYAEHDNGPSKCSEEREGLAKGKNQRARCFSFKILSRVFVLNI